MTGKGRLTASEERACLATLGLGAEPLAYVCARLYLFVAAPQPKWVFAGLSGALFLVRGAGRYYFILVDLKGYKAKFVHEVHQPFAMKFMSPNFYCFHSDTLGAVVGIKACEGPTEAFVDAVTHVVAEQAARRRLNTSAGTAHDTKRRAVRTATTTAATPSRKVPASAPALSVDVPQTPRRGVANPLVPSPAGSLSSSPGESSSAGLSATRRSGRSVVDVIDEMYMEAVAEGRAVPTTPPRAAPIDYASFGTDAASAAGVCDAEGDMQSPIARLFSADAPPSRRSLRSPSSLAGATTPNTARGGCALDAMVFTPPPASRASCSEFL